MTKEDFIKLGFEPLPNFTVMDSLIYRLGRNRHLSVGSVGTPNEMLWICQSSKDNPNKIEDLICLHNYDYDGPITETKIKKLIESLNG